VLVLRMSEALVPRPASSSEKSGLRRRAPTNASPSYRTVRSLSSLSYPSKVTCDTATYIHPLARRFAAATGPPGRRPSRVVISGLLCLRYERASFSTLLARKKTTTRNQVSSVSTGELTHLERAKIVFYHGTGTVMHGQRISYTGKLGLYPASHPKTLLQ
jgi:hypothetical protein